jgi:glyoxylase-like metal-dependent hydrolase (beta-lactamase superfamily II)
MSLSRRSLLAAGAAAVATPWLSNAAAARAPIAGAQVPGVYRTRVGGFEVTALLDGYIDLGRQLFPEADPAAADALLDKAFLPRAPTIRTPVNAYAVNSGERLVLIDTGTAQAMGPGLGHLPASLQAAGIDPATVDAVLLTHMHPDHVNGLLTPQGVAAFANAELLAAEAEAAFWLDESALGRVAAEIKPFFEMAQKAVKPYAGRMRTFVPGGEALPGITSLAARGHTPGHTAYRIDSDGQQLLIWGDIVHAAALQFAHPEWAITFDTDQNQAIDTRRRLLEMVVADRMAIAGMHLPFPGMGHVAREAAGYAFVPLPFAPL